MTPIEIGEVVVDQVLHGYREGHRRLAGSISLDEASHSTMLLMSDLLTDSLSGPNDSYLCGYPIRGSHLYVLARTWLALELPRPGCVWTHSLVFDYAALARISNLPSVLRNLKRPSSDDLVSYDTRITLTQESGHSGTANEKDAASRWQQFSTDMGRWIRAAQYLYGTNRPRLLLRSTTSRDDEALAIALWEQMWPRLRRSFMFCSKLSGSLKGVPSECALLFSTEAAEESADLFVEAATWSATESAFQALVADLASQTPTELRRFLWRYTVDVQDQRQSAVPLCSVYLDLASSQAAVGAAVEKIRRYFADSEQARLLKTDVLLGRNYTSLAAAYTAFTEMFDAFASEKAFVQAELVSARMREFDKAGTLKISEILNTAASCELGTLGDVALQSVADAVSLERIAEADLTIESKKRVAQLKTGILLHEEFWPRTPDERLEIWDAATLPTGDFGVVVGACSRMIVGREAELLIRKYGKEAFRQLVRILDREVDRTVYVALAQFPKDLVEAIEANSPIPLPTLEALAEELENSKNSTAVDWDHWLNVIAALPVASGIDGSHSIAAITFKCGIRAPEPACTTLFEMSFDRLHRAAASGRLPNRVRHNLEPSLPVSVGAPTWDFCAKLRSAVLSRYVRGPYVDASLIQVSRDGDALSLILADLVNLPNGRDLLQSLRFEVSAKNGHQYTSAQTQAIEDAIVKSDADEKQAWWRIF